MNLSHDMNRIERWADTHHPIWIDFLRIALGLFIFAIGIMFIMDTAALQTVMRNSQFQWLSFGIAHYVAFAHLVGGLMIAMGLKTRIAVLFQLPILIGAVFFINPQRGFFSQNYELWTSIIVLALLLFFLVFGSGRFSIDHKIEKSEKDFLY